MSAALVCPACDEVVLEDVVALADMHLGYTWLGDRMRWTSDHFGLIHLCDPLRRELVYARDGRLVAHPPWIRFLFRHRVLRPLARRLRTPEFTDRVRFENAGRRP